MIAIVCPAQQSSNSTIKNIGRQCEIATLSLISIGPCRIHKRVVCSFFAFDLVNTTRTISACVNEFFPVCILPPFEKRASIESYGTTKHFLSGPHKPSTIPMHTAENAQIWGVLHIFYLFFFHFCFWADVWYVFGVFFLLYVRSMLWRLRLPHSLRLFDVVFFF